MPLKRAWNITKQTFSDFFQKKILKLSAALAYYTIFSLPALLIIIIWVTDIFYGREAIEGSIYGQITDFVGRDAALQIQETIRNATLSTDNTWAAIIGITTLVFNFIFTFFVTAFLFGIIFKVLPDARIKWKDVRAGDITTALLFMGGRFLISYYLGQSNKLASAYGAAGSIIVILLWVYYSAIILYFGAVFTRVHAISRGCQIYPNDYAVWVEEKELISHESLKQHEKNNPIVQEEQATK